MTQQGVISRLEREPIGSLLVAYSLPAIISMVTVSLYNICSGIFIGHGVGALGITGLAVTFPFMNLVLAVCMFVAIGGATVCSIELGAGNPERAAQVLGHNVILSVAFAVVFAAASLAFIDPILFLFGASEDSIGHARDYMRIILWGAPIGNLTLAFNHFLRASGYPAKAMVISLFSIGLLAGQVFHGALHGPNSKGGVLPPAVMEALVLLTGGKIPPLHMASTFAVFLH